MKVVETRIKKYVAFDGTEFDSRKKCEIYESKRSSTLRVRLHEMGKERQSVKNELRGLERSIVHQRDKARNLIRHKGFMRGCAVTEMTSKYLARLAVNLRRCDEFRAKLADLRERQGIARDALDRLEREEPPHDQD